MKKKFKLPSKFRGTSGLTILENGLLHAVRYTWIEGLTIKELADKGIIRVKSGIARELRFDDYIKSFLRGDSTGKKPLIWDDNFIDQSLTYEQASEVIRLMDSTFKTMMKDNGYQSRQLHKDKNLGTEMYESDDLDSLLDTINYTWDKAYRLAYQYVTKTELTDVEIIEQFFHRPLQDTLITIPSIEAFRTIDKLSWQITGGAGKSKCSCYVSQQVCKEHNLAWKVLGVAPDVSTTVQLCDEFAKFYRGQTGKRLMDIYIVGSADPTKHYKVLSSWANIISVSNTDKLNLMLQHTTSSNRDCAIFVVNKSANDLLVAADKLGVDFTEFFTILDEIHNYATEHGTPKLVTSPSCAVINPKFDHLFGKKLGLSATHILRPEGVDRVDAVFNNDEDKFGPCKINIPEIDSRSYGWICDKQGVIFPVPSDPIFAEALANRQAFTFNINGYSFKFNPLTFVGSEAIRLLAHNHNKIIVLASMKKDVADIAKLLREQQALGLIDGDIEIMEGYADASVASVTRFNKGKRVIMIATRWIGVGNDTYTCDCTIPLYNPKSRAYARQFGMRGDRIDGDKITTFALVSHEDHLEDSPFFESLQMISNGQNLEIVSESRFVQLRTRITGGRVTGNITLVRAERNNSENASEMAVMWEEIAKCIAKRDYIDEVTGKTRFSEITGGYITDYTYDMILSFVTNKGYNSAVEWYSDIEGGGLRYFVAAGRLNIYEDICEAANLKYKKYYTKEMFIKFKDKYNITFNTTKKEFDKFAEQEGYTEVFRRVAIREGWISKDFLSNAKPGFDAHDKPTVDMVTKWILDNKLQGVGRSKARKHTTNKDKSDLGIGASKMVEVYTEYVDRGMMEDLLKKSSRDLGKKINVINKEGNIEYVFDKVKEASNTLGINAAAISNVLTGRAKTAGGFIWKYADQDNNNFKLNK